MLYEEIKMLGVTEDHIIKIALDNVRNDELLNAKNRYKAIANTIKDENCYYFFWDEIQLVENFEDVVNGIKRDFNCDIYITVPL